MIDQFKQKLEETAALPPDDSQRQDFERRLANESESAQQHWQDLLLENESFRDNLAKIPVPDDLQQRLLSIPEPVSEIPKRVFKPIHYGWALAAAAAMLMMLTAGLTRHYTSNSRMRTVALLAINNHLNHLQDHGVDAQSIDKAELEQSLTKQVGFQVTVPDLENGLHLEGGRKCQLGTHPVAFTLWKEGQSEYSLFQFETDRFGLAASIKPTLVRNTQPAGTEHTTGAWIWTRGKYGYVLTGDPGNDLQRLSPAL